MVTPKQEGQLIINFHQPPCIPYRLFAQGVASPRRDENGGHVGAPHNPENEPRRSY